MKKQLLFINLLILSLGLLLIPNTQAQQCPKTGNRPTDYIQREGDKRCEGIVKRLDQGGDFSLVSLTIGRMKTLTEPLKLEVPNINNKKPEIKIYSLQQKYQLIPLRLRTRGYNYKFQWSNAVIKTEKIPLENLNAKAFITAPQIVYLPVIFNSSANEYNIVLNADRRVSITEFKIQQKNNVIYQTSRSQFQPKGQIFFSWNGRKKDGKIAPAGSYQLRVKAKLEQDDAPPENASVNITFKHNPQWLK
ncbi:MAG TPA: hypothetical protein DCF68_18410 [Cyanothece sp. UBA12306]|nr:hypothetical protein [Cyanothece sp. UBA12306]